MAVQTRAFEVITESGFGAIESSKFCKVVGKFQANVQVRRWCSDVNVDGRSIMGLMMLALTRGSFMVVAVNGTDAANVFDAIIELDDLVAPAPQQKLSSETAELNRRRQQEEEWKEELKTIHEKQEKELSELKDASSEVYSLPVDLIRLIVSDQNRMRFTGIFREAFGERPVLSVFDTHQVYDTFHIALLLKPPPGLIALPLSIPNYCSIRIAETVHKFQLGTRVILVSETECSPRFMEILFDDFVRPQNLTKEWLRSSLRPTVNRLNDEEMAWKVINKILEEATCFKTYGGRHLHENAPSLSQYYGEENIGEHITVPLHDRVQSELAQVSQELSGMSDLSDEERELIEFIHMRNEDVRHKTAAPTCSPEVGAWLAEKALRLMRIGRITNPLPMLTAFLRVPPVFISYSEKDKAFVDVIEEALKKANFSVWRDSNEGVSGPIEDQVGIAIQQCVVVVILSADSLNSDWVEWEVRRAREAGKAQKRHILCPIRIDDSWPTARWPQRLREQLEEYVILDFSGWRDPRVFQEMLQRLMCGLTEWYLEQQW